MANLAADASNEMNTDQTKHKNSEETTRLRIRNELSEMTFAELQELKEKIGTKMFNKMTFKDDSNDTDSKQYSRENKNRPREMTSKRQVARHRDVVQTTKKITRDPRFDDLSGRFDEKIFNYSYSFLQDIKAQEKEEVKRELKEETDPKRKKKIKSLLQRMTNQEREEKRKQEEREKRVAKRKEVEEQVHSGKKPYFIKKSEAKKMELIEKFEELQRTNKLDKYLIRKRKKNAKQERRNAQM